MESARLCVRTVEEGVMTKSDDQSGAVVIAVVVIAVVVMMMVMVANVMVVVVSERELPFRHTPKQDKNGRVYLWLLYEHEAMRAG